LDDLQLDPALTVSSQEETKRMCVQNLLGNPRARIFFKDREGRFLLVSAGWKEAFGRGMALAEIVGRTDLDFFSGSFAAAAVADEQQVLETGAPILAKLERDASHGDRSDTWAQTSKFALRDAHHDIVGTWGITQDVTTRVEAEQALRESREQLELSENIRAAMFDNNPQPMFVYERETRQIVAVNDAGVMIYGYSRDELLTMQISELVARESLEDYYASLKPTPGVAACPPLPQSRRHRYKDGTIVDAEVTSNDVVLEGRSCRIASVQDVTERTRAVAEIAAARDGAVEASNMKSAFLATISHEIRTPMNGVLGMTELLLDTGLDANQRELADQVSRSGQLMLDLLSDILDISKIEAGQLAIDVGDYALHEAIEAACAPSRIVADAKGLTFDVQIDDSVPEVARGDGRRLAQILLNLVSNAVKFTSVGEVRVYAAMLAHADAARTLRIEVSDSGIGIEPAALERMFEPFTQADVSTTRNYGGTGLGLAIARELTELMGGTIGAEERPGAGSRFWIELPLSAPIPLPERAPKPSERVIAATPVWARTPLVLVAEDSPVNQIVAARTLERCGCQSDVAMDGRQALEMLALRHYDAVLMDCQMPVMDGYAATTELRRREDGHHRTPVIALTAHAMDGDRDRCLAAGMDDYITKPIRRDELIEALRRLIAPQQEHRDAPPASDTTEQSVNF
jgi:PAS domain S-box-containing protein